MLKDFKEFALKGNVVDMAVGVIIGGAFGAIVTSLVNDVLMPPIGHLAGGLDFKDLVISLGAHVNSLAEAKEKKVPVIAIGIFLNAVINFVIVALCMFFVVKSMNKAKKEEAPAAPPSPPEPTTQEKLLTEIRDLLKKG